jgi:hypothetical protein
MLSVTRMTAKTAAFGLGQQCLVWHRIADAATDFRWSLIAREKAVVKEKIVTTELD